MGAYSPEAHIHKIPVVSYKRKRDSLRQKTKKVADIFARAFLAVCACYPNKESDRHFAEQHHDDHSLTDLPPEILFRIVDACDFTSQMNLRVTSRRMLAIVERAGKARRQVIGGMEIGSGPRIGMEPTPGCSNNSEEKDRSEKRLLLRRFSRQHGQLLETAVPIERMHGVMRLLCICHSLHVRGVSVDDIVAGQLLSAEYRAVRDLVLDNISTISERNLLDLLKKVDPMQSVYVFNHTTEAAARSISPSLIHSVSACEIAIESAPGYHIVHPLFDDAALVELAVCDSVVRRSIRLPLSIITHNGIVEAAKAFYSRCHLLVREGGLLSSPVWEMFITLPGSQHINRSLVLVPSEMRNQCRRTWRDTVPPSLSLEVRVVRMSLRIRVLYGGVHS